MLLSSTAIVLYDIATAARGLTANRRATRVPGMRESEDEVDALAKKVARALQRPSSFQVIETLAAETIMTAAYAANGLNMPKSDRIKQNDIENVFRDPQIAGFVKDRLIKNSPGFELKRGQMLSELQHMIAILDKAAEELI